MEESAATIEDRIKKVIVERLKLSVDARKISRNTPLIGKGLGLDSVSLQELVVAIEHEFQIGIDDDDINHELLQDINSISKYVFRKLNSQ